MAVLKRKTVGGSKYKLVQKPSNRSGKQYEYYVTEDGSKVDDPVYTRQEGMQEFRDTIKYIRRAEGEDRNEARGPSFMGMGQSSAERSMPGFGMGGDGDDDDEREFPGFGF